MKTILTAWALALSVYMVTPLVYANEAEQVIWTGYNVVGDVCVEMKPGEAQLQGMAVQVQNHKGMREVYLKTGLNCLDIGFSSRTALVAASNRVALVSDNTTPFVTIELPF